MSATSIITQVKNFIVSPWETNLERNYKGYIEINADNILKMTDRLGRLAVISMLALICLSFLGLGNAVFMGTVTPLYALGAGAVLAATLYFFSFPVRQGYLF